MTFLAHFAGLLLICLASNPISYFQTQTEKRPGGAATVSGKLSIKGKPAAGVVVTLRPSNSREPSTSTYRGTTDQDGNYKITNVPAGTFQVAPDAPQYSFEPREKILIIMENENVQGIDFDLVRGGVITGKVTDSAGQPLIEQTMNYIIDEGNRSFSSSGAQTDDRGVYRLFGLRPGKYKVSVEPSRMMSIRQARFVPTFYPAETDASKASVVDVTEGSESTGIDVTVALKDEKSNTFSVSGRVVDKESGRSVPGVRLVAHQVSERQTQFFGNVPVSDNDGRFQLDLSPGKYYLSALPGVDSDLRVETLTFEVVDKELSGLELKTITTGSISGIVVLEGQAPKTRTSLDQLSLQANFGPMQPRVNSIGIMNFGSSSRVKPDGSFHVAGFTGAGFVNFSLASAMGGPPKGLTIVRIERDGIQQLRGIEIREGEEVAGVRIVLAQADGVIRGVVKIENGELPTDGRISVWLTNTQNDQEQVRNNQATVDSRGHFLIEGIPAGSYIVNAIVMAPNQRTLPTTTKQQVTVSDGSMTEITITVDLNSVQKPQ